MVEARVVAALASARAVQRFSIGGRGIEVSYNRPLRAERAAGRGARWPCRGPRCVIGWVMIDAAAAPSPFQSLSPTTLADVLTRDRVMDLGVRPLWAGMPRIAGPAYPVRCVPGDNLMVHAAIYRAPPGAILVVEAGTVDFAVAGGNVCAVAQRRGIAGFVVDGVIRDLAEVRAIRFPVLARGVVPIAGVKAAALVLNGPVRCGGVEVAPGDVVVADEEGVVVVPVARAESVLAAAHQRAAKDASGTLEAWEALHRARIDELLRQRGIVD